MDGIPLLPILNFLKDRPEFTGLVIVTIGFILERRRGNALQAKLDEVYDKSQKDLLSVVKETNGNMATCNTLLGILTRGRR